MEGGLWQAVSPVNNGVDIQCAQGHFSGNGPDKIVKVDCEKDNISRWWKENFMQLEEKYEQSDGKKAVQY